LVCGGEQPRTGGLTAVEVDLNAVLRDQEILVERRDGPVVFELAASVVGFGGLGKNLGDQDRIK